MEESQPQESQRVRRPVSGRTLGIRVLVGAILIPLVLAVTYLGGIVFALFVAILAGLGSYEFYRMASAAGWQASRTVGIVGSICLCLAFHFGRGVLPALVLTAFLLVLLTERIVRSTREQYLSSLAVTLLGAIYSGWLLGFFLWLRNIAGDFPGMSQIGRFEIGTLLVYFVLILTWSYDSVAYLVGSLVGRHKLFPRISPSKTTEGTLAGLLGSVAAALISRATFVPFLSYGHAIVLGFLIGVVAQIGDLAESMIKRSTGAKDSSNLIPGHGGILDRFDSLLFAGPVFYLYVRFVLW